MNPDEINGVNGLIDRMPVHWQPWVSLTLVVCGLMMVMGPRLRAWAALFLPAAPAPHPLPQHETVATLAAHLGSLNHLLVVAQEAAQEAAKKAEEAARKCDHITAELIECYRMILGANLSGEPPEKAHDLIALARIGLRRLEAKK